MKRIILTVLSTLILLPLNAQQMKLTKTEKAKIHSIEIADFGLERVVMKFPRPVGKNSFKESHGKGPVVYFSVLKTTDGRQGIGQVNKSQVNKDNLHEFKAMTKEKLLKKLDLKTDDNDAIIKKVAHSKIFL